MKRDSRLSDFTFKDVRSLLFCERWDVIAITALAFKTPLNSTWKKIIIWKFVYSRTVHFYLEINIKEELDKNNWT